MQPHMEQMMQAGMQPGTMHPHALQHEMMGTDTAQYQLSMLGQQPTLMPHQVCAFVCYVRSCL